MWFAEATHNNELFKRFENRFQPLFNEEKHFLLKQNHVDNNVFGSLPLELYMKTKQKKYLDLGLMKEAVLGFSFSIGEKYGTSAIAPEFSVKNGILNARWNDLKLSIPVKPQPLPKNL